MIIANETQEKDLLEAGKRLRDVLETVRKEIKAGVKTKELDEKAYKMIIDYGDKPSFLNYQPEGSKIKFPATLCVSINDEMVHGIPNEETVIKDGDLVTIDCGLIHKGFFVDAAVSVGVGEIDEKAKRLLYATALALEKGINAARAGARVGEIGEAVEKVSKMGNFMIPPELGGHGVGAAVHEEPFIPNMADYDYGEKLKEGQVIAIEPIFTEGDTPIIETTENNFTYRAIDKARSAHFEHTILITKEEPIIVTGGLMWDYEQFKTENKNKGCCH